MEPLVTDLLARLHPPLSKPLSAGVEVETPRGYGTVVGTTGDGLGNFGASTRFGPPVQTRAFVLVEMEDGTRVPFLPERLRVIGRE